MYVTPSGFPPPPPPPISNSEILAFDNTGQCNIDQRIKKSVMNRRIRSIRVQRVDGKIFRWDVLTKEGTLHELLKQEWHGIAGENDGFKLLAGDSPNPDQNFYLFNDGDTANYDVKGCPRAGSKANFGKSQVLYIHLHTLHASDFLEQQYIYHTIHRLLLTRYVAVHTCDAILMLYMWADQVGWHPNWLALDGKPSYKTLRRLR